MKGLLFALLIIGTGIDAQAESFETQKETVLESTVLFSQDKATISKDGVRKLGSLSAGETEVIGFASSEGDYDYNLDLSHRRASAVAGILNRPNTVLAFGETEADKVVNPLDRKVLIRVTTTELVYNPIFSVDGTLQGVLSHQLYNVIPVR